VSWGEKTLTRRKIGGIIVREYVMGHFTGVWFFSSSGVAVSFFSRERHTGIWTD
jgi:hypothetical protein